MRSLQIVRQTKAQSVRDETVAVPFSLRRCNCSEHKSYLVDLMNSVRSRTSALGRVAVCRVNVYSRKRRHGVDTSAGIFGPDLSFTIRNSAAIGSRSEYGGLEVSISMTVQPRPQMSAFSL